MTVTVFEIVADCPRSFRTVSVTVKVLADVKRWVVAIPEPLEPSPKSHEKVPSASVEDEALKKTVSPVRGSVGENTKLAVPAGSVVEIVICRVVAAVSPASVVTRSVTANVPPRVNRCVI